MEIKENNVKEWLELEESARTTHNFYLFLFAYVVMTVYLHYIDLKDGSYDWAYYSWILMTFSLIWMTLITFPFSWKSKMILKEMKKRNANTQL